MHFILYQVLRATTSTNVIVHQGITVKIAKPKKIFVKCSNNLASEALLAFQNMILRYYHRHVLLSFKNMILIQNNLPYFNQSNYPNFQSYKCLCQPGYTGKHCDVDINDCLPNPCGNGGRCVDGIANYQCFCADGWEGEHCEININECLSYPCVNGTCADTQGSYDCSCEPGVCGKNCDREDPCQQVRNHTSLYKISSFQRFKMICTLIFNFAF